MKKYVTVLTWLLLPATFACQSTKSSNPLSPSVAGPIPGVSISAPRPLDPSPGGLVDVTKQPLTLIVENATSSGVRPLTYRFEIAVDANFTNELFLRDTIVPGDAGRTSVRLPDRLPGGRTYYWRARAEDGANTGPYSDPADFNVFIPIVLSAPTPVAPVNGVTVSNLHPRFTFVNAPTSGPVGTITYTMEVSTNDSFTNNVAVWGVSEQPGQTNLDSPADLNFSQLLFWHVRANDSSGAIGPWSVTQSFRTPAPPPPPVAAPPPGANPGVPCNTLISALAIVQCRRAQYGTPMSSDQHVSFLRGVASDLNTAGIAPGGFGLLRKAGGATCSGFACDIICSGNGAAQLQWDVLSDSEGRAAATWRGPHTVPHIRIDLCAVP